MEILIAYLSSPNSYIRPMAAMQMNYLKQETQFIYEMKKSIVNEFRYLYSSTDLGFLGILVEPDMSIDIDSLQHAFKIGMSHDERKKISKLKFVDLFNQAIGELFSEGLINFRDSATVIMTERGENMYIIPDKWYK